MKNKTLSELIQFQTPNFIYLFWLDIVALKSTFLSQIFF